MNGTAILLPTVGQNGASRNSRYYYSSSSSGTYTDPNRVFPGVELGPSVSQTNYKIWQGLTKVRRRLESSRDRTEVSVLY